MQFDSLAYLALLCATLVGFFAAPRRVRPLVLITASAVFYGAWSVEFLALIGISAVVDYTCGLALPGAKGRRRLLVLCASVVTNLGILGYFKYANFFIENVQGVLGDSVAPGLVEVLLPPGISFYTFQTMSYTIDVYRGELRPERSFARFLVYVSFFPQLVAGPIERASRLLPQLEASYLKRAFTGNLVAGTQLITWGLFKKVVIADHCAALATPVYDSPGNYGSWAALVATYAFTLQIYCDFSAYSEIARGSARLFGVRLMRNFDQPYLVSNVREFWRHWHISLSQWFRDYVYRPLGGNRSGRARALANVAATMFLSGLWHGAAWTFVVWGLYHGLLLLVHSLATSTRVYRALASRLGKVWTMLGVVVTFHFVVVGWVVFRASTFADATTVLTKISAIGSAGLPSTSQVVFLVGTIAFLGFSALARRLLWRERIDASPVASALMYSVVLLAIVMWRAEVGAQFIYFQF